jgi:carboxylesterase
MTIEAEQERSRREGVVREENLPFLMEPRQPSTAAVVLVHGFTATPWEMRLFGEAAAEAGFTALGVRLPGHGTTPEDLAKRRYEEWLDSVEEGWRMLSGRGLRVYGIGQSTGGLLLLAAAARLPIAGLVLLSPFLRLRHRLAPAAGLIRFFRSFQRRPVLRELAPFYYDRRPVNGVYQLHRLIRRVRNQLEKVTAPTLLIGAKGDRTVQVDSAYELFDALPGPRKQCHFFGPEVPHILTTGENPRLRQTLRLTFDFLRSLEEENASGGGRVP